MKKEFKAVIQTEKENIIIFFNDINIYLDIEQTYKGIYTRQLYRKINGRYVLIAR